MDDLAYCIENFHKPRMSKLAEFLLTESEFTYDFHEPPVFETHLIQIKLPEELILSINYFPIEITDEAPYLFLQLHCQLAELEHGTSEDFLKYLMRANNDTELSAFNLDGNALYLKTVLIDDAEAELDLPRISFALRIFYNNLFSQISGFRHIIGGGSYEGAIDL